MCVTSSTTLATIAGVVLISSALCIDARLSVGAGFLTGRQEATVALKISTTGPAAEFAILNAIIAGIVARIHQAVVGVREISTGNNIRFNRQTFGVAKAFVPLTSVTPRKTIELIIH